MLTRQLVLASGLRCSLYHQPDARDAAALVRVQAGSLDEPDSWPGLAHLLEHLLFCGSERFSGDQRLMPWVQQQGGHVNATTQLRHSAFFCQVPAEHLAAATSRLGDMLAAPLLEPAAVQQECAVIDAEYRLLQNHADTLQEAALLDALGGDFQRFRVGSQQRFGDNVTELRAALRTFHQRYWQAANMQLWLQGPQSLDELEQLAHRVALQLPAGHAPVTPLQPQPGADRILHLAGEACFWLALILQGEPQDLRDNVTLLRTFWCDEAPGSLLAQLRQQRLCDALQVEWLWQDAQHSGLALRFSGPDITPQAAQQIEQHFWHALTALERSSPAQRQHYQRLALQDFLALTPLEQLRGRALGFAPSASLPAGFSRSLALLQSCTPVRLLAQPHCRESQPRMTQGFTLQLAPWPAPAAIAQPRVRFHFYPSAAPLTLPPQPATARPLPLVSPRQPQETLLLRPAFYHTLHHDWARARQHALRPLLAELRHAGGNGSWQQVQGNWQLTLNLPPQQEAALQCVWQAIQALNQPAEMLPAPPSTIAIRQLLDALPAKLIAPQHQPAWLAAWCGQQAQWHQYAAHLLSHFTSALAVQATPPTLQCGVTAVPCQGNDRALLLFMPLPLAGDRAYAALRALALMLEPRFFQQLRVEQQVGYVVSARYQRVADVDGLLLALQSPAAGWRTLLCHCLMFMRRMTAEIARATPEMLAAWQQSLQAQCDVRNNAEAAVLALRQQQQLPTLTHSAIRALTVAHIQHLHATMLHQRRRWRMLINQNDRARSRPHAVPE